MNFAPDAYAEGISNHAAGSEIEVLVDTIDETIEALERSGEYWGMMISGLPEHAEEERGHQEKMDAVIRLQERWKLLRIELANHPENAELSFAEEEED